jgi:hypothetical protein
VRLRSSVPAFLAILAIGAACQRNPPPPAANCAGVADILTSFEVGSAASLEQRAPVVAKHKAACESIKVTADEAKCLRLATDTWAAKACLPRMFPAQPAAANSECDTVTARMRAAVMSEVGSNGAAASAQLDKLLPVIKVSCEQDAWPKPVVKCVVDAKQGDMIAFQTCVNQLPKETQDKMQQRLVAVMQEPAGGHAGPAPSPQPPSPAPQQPPSPAQQPAPQPPFAPK